MKSSVVTPLLILILFTSACTENMEERFPHHQHDPVLVGHRGATGYIPENTIPSFLAALEMDVDAIEFDVVLSGEGEAIISHEPWFRHDICLDPDGNRITLETEREHSIITMTYEEIVAWDCGSIQRPGFTQQQSQPLSKPRMTDAIRQVESRIAETDRRPVTWYVEIKSSPDWEPHLQPDPETIAGTVYRELSGLGVLGRSVIMSFDVRILEVVRELDANLALIYLVGGGSFRENMQRISFLPEVYSPHFSQVDATLLNDVHKAGMELHTWTVNETKDIRRMQELGVDAIITDYPDRYFEARQ